MIKTLFLTGTAMFVAGSAFAVDYNPYVSLKGSYATMRNDATSTSGFFNPNEQKFINNTIINDKIHDEVWGLKVAAGVKFNNAIRAELEYSYNDKAKKSGNSSFKFGSQATAYPLSFNQDLRVQALFANFYYDFENESKFTPYVGVGLGVAHLKSEATGSMPALAYNTKGSDSSNEFAYNLNVGVDYALTDNVSIDFGYRYTDYGKMTDHAQTAETAAYSKFKVTSHEALLGLRYMF